MVVTNQNGEQSIKKFRLLIANRGEISLRIQRSSLLFPRPEFPGIEFIPFVIFTKEEENSLFVQNVPKEQRILLEGNGPRSYLDSHLIIKKAKQNQIWGIIPGYGFLSENYEFAKLCEENGIEWCGPPSKQLRILSDKVLAKRLAIECDVPTLECTLGEYASLEEIHSFAKKLKNQNDPSAKMMIKAVNGGGGRGMRIVEDLENISNITKSFESCQRESKASFNDERVYAERFLSKARHIEVQIIGDGKGNIIHLWERECSLQRKHQKIIEIAPSPSLSNELRNEIIQASIKMAKKVSFKSLGTFEFLCLPNSKEFFFMEINPRIQVEHTITEQITGKDLVAIQLCIALGKSLNEIELQQDLMKFPNLTSIQVRINAEKFLKDGNVHPTSGNLKRFNLPFGPSIRIDTNAHSPLSSQKVYKQTPLFDSLLAKIIFTAPTYTLAIQMTKQALNSTIIEGFETNLFFVRSLIESEQIRTNDGIHTRFIEENFEQLFEKAQSLSKSSSASKDEKEKEDSIEQQLSQKSIPEGMKSIQSPLSGMVIEINVKLDEKVQKGQEIAILESMKMEHVIRSEIQGTIKGILVKKGNSINENEHLVFIQIDENTEDEKNNQANTIDQKEDSNEIRSDLKELIETKLKQSDQKKQKSVQRRHDQGYLTARENIERLIDKGTFIEWGDLTIAAQRTRIDEEELIEKTMNDGVITGWATINGKLFIDSDLTSNARCALCIYDYMVLAGTQGYFHHLKLDRLFRSILQNPAPLILYAEGGGGRPGDVDLVNIKVGGLDTPSFTLLAAIRARGYPTVGLANGYTFAGNAALLGTCDIVIATEGGLKTSKKPGITSTGMGGPAMIEGGGLGKVLPQDVGRVDIHYKNGDYDILVPTEREASEMIKKVISFFQGPTKQPHWKYSKQEKDLRTSLPKQRTRAYEVRNVIELLSDDESFIELGKGWGHSIITGLARFAGQPVGILASSVLSPLGGAIDSQSARKATRFIQMLHRTNSAHLLVLCDTPGFMVGTSAEKEGGLRSFAEFFSTITQFQDGQNGGRIFSVTIRKAYGLGAQALLGGSTLSNFFSVAWPQGEFAAMGIEGAVRLGMRKELESAKEGQERDDLFKSLVDMMYQRGKAQNMAAMAEIDTVIDPAETRNWLINGLRFTRQRIPTWKSDSHKHSSHL